MFRSQHLCEGPDNRLVKPFRGAGGPNEAFLIVGECAAQVRVRPKCRQHAASVERHVKTPRQIPGDGFPAVDILDK